MPKSMYQMMFILFFCIFFFLKVDVIQSHQLSPKIVNGTNVKSVKYPFLVAIYISDTYVCGGAIINKSFVLSAAHCFDEYEGPIRIKVGLTDLNAKSQFFKVEKMWTHEDFSRDTYVHDIALLKMKKPFYFDKFIKPIKLPKSNEIMKVNQSVTVAGWGYTTNGGEVSNKLKETKLVISDYKQCRKVYAEKHSIIINKNNQFCARSSSGISGPCSGDSGSPVFSMVSSNKKKRAVLLGIESFAEPDQCGNSKYPDVMTRVSEYLDWIKY